MTLDAARAFLAEHPTIEEIDLLACDLNGVLRGKRIPATAIDKVFSDGMKFPRSVLCLDVWGEDVFDNGLVWESGDGDGICLPCGPGLMPIPWSPRPRAQMLTMMEESSGQPFGADPRQILAGVVEKFKALGLTPVVATELEFYLMAGDSITARPRPPAAPKSGYALDAPRVYSMDELDEFSAVLEDLRDACLAQGIPADAILVENGPGQFEINFNHVADPMLAADHGALFHRLVRMVARQHDMHATFMAKPYDDAPGSGLHVHCSLLDRDGNNVFDNGGPEGSDILRHAVAGVLAAMKESMLVFAPHLNSYRRFQPGLHAPTLAVWGYENRTTALRIPVGPGKARRIEHRVSGADANPYLVVAALLAGILHGITNSLEPAAPIDGDAYAEGASPPGVNLPTEWGAAIDAFNAGTILRPLFGDVFMRAFGLMKRQEMNRLGRRITDIEYATYLGIL